MVVRAGFVGHLVVKSTYGAGWNIGETGCAGGSDEGSEDDGLHFGCGDWNESTFSRAKRMGYGRRRRMIWNRMKVF